MPSTRDVRVTTFGKENYEKLLKGASAVADPVKSTMGPKGRNVIIDRKYGPPTVTKDGVTVAKEIFCEDAVENMGAQLVKEACVKTNQTSGDGTTTSAVLAQALFAGAVKEIEAGKSPVDVKNAIDAGVKSTVEFLKSKALKVKDLDLRAVARISANNEKLGDFVFEVMGDDPSRVVSIEDSNGTEVLVEKVEGLRIEKGWLSQYMLTDAARLESAMDDCAVVVVDGKISSNADIVPLFQIFASNNIRKVVVVAEDIETDALKTLVINNIKVTQGGNSIFTLFVKSPGYGNTKVESLKDLAAVTGGQVFGQAGASLATPKLEDVGRARRVVATSEHTTITGGSGVAETVAKRLETVKAMLAEAKSQFDKDELSKRMSKLTGGVAVIKVGATTETEAEEVKQRVEDAVQAVAAAAEEGILPGGGNALYCAAREFDKTQDNFFWKALLTPYEQICDNAGLIDPSGSMPAPGGWDAGLNVSTSKFVPSLIADGVIDPLKVTRLALENAGSVAGQLTMAACSVAYTNHEVKDDGR